MHVLCSTDTNYIMPTGVMMKSICVNNEVEEIFFHVIVDEFVTYSLQEQLRTVVEEYKNKHVVFYTFDNKLLNTFPRIGEVKENYLTKTAYYRLFVTEILPSELDKIIYLDCDIIVDKPINKLWSRDISNYAVAAVTDMSEKWHDYNRLGYEAELGYFNSGVMVINLNYWREHHVIDDFMNIIINHPEMIKLHDQDVLNIVFCKNKFNLPLTYNVQNGFLYKPEYQQMDYEKYKYELNAAINSGTIIHFCNDLKPWYKDCDNPLREKWLQYLKLTKWKNYRLKRKHPLPFRTLIGDFLRKYHLRKSLYKERYNPYVELRSKI